MTVAAKPELSAGSEAASSVPRLRDCAFPCRASPWGSAATVAWVCAHPRGRRQGQELDVLGAGDEEDQSWVRFLHSARLRGQLGGPRTNLSRDARNERLLSAHRPRRRKA